MKQKYLFLFFCITVVFILFEVTSLLPQKSSTKSSFSLVAVNPTNLIDINKLSQSDWDNVSIEDYGGVFVYKNDSPKQVYFNDKQLQSLELSPSRKKVAFYYYSDEPEDHELSLRLLDLDNTSTREIFHTTFPSWDVRSGLHWLGNNHIIFLRNCGTSCQGLTLLNIQTGEIKNATLSYMLSSDRPAYTHFEDWFGNNHEVNNFVEKVYTETVEGKYYLLFNMNTETGEKSGQEKFLFTESNLTLEF